MEMTAKINAKMTNRNVGLIPPIRTSELLQG